MNDRPKPIPGGLTPLRRRIARLEAAVLALLLFCLVLASVLGATMHRAKAHFEAQWIERDPETAWCCSAIQGDCEAVPGRVTYDGSWRVQGLNGELLDGQKGLYWKSPDGRPWACRTPSTNALRCLFMSPSQG